MSGHENKQMRERISRERKAQKAGVTDYFLAVLVTIGLFVIGGGLYGLPKPFNIIALMCLAVFWYYLLNKNWR